MFIDTHVHFDSFVEKGLFDGLLENAASAGVGKMVAVGGSAEANELALKLAGEHEGLIFASAGYDRDLAEMQPNLSELRSFAEHPQVKAIGECGLDYFYTPETAPEQRKLFASNLELAAEFSKPVIVHSREADDDTVDVLKEYAKNWQGDAGQLGVLHCFTRERDFCRKVLDLGLLISFSGIVSFRNADPLREVAKYVPDDRLLIETDSPYLAPVPQRGKRNEPAFVVHVAEMLAEVRGSSVESIELVTAANAERLFGI